MFLKPVNPKRKVMYCCRIFESLSIVAVSGITWALFLVIILTGITNTRSSELWENYIYIVINSSQLVLVAVTYVCSKNMMRRYYKTFQQCKCCKQPPPKMTDEISLPSCIRQGPHLQCLINSYEDTHAMHNG